MSSVQPCLSISKIIIILLSNILRFLRTLILFDICHILSTLWTCFCHRCRLISKCVLSDICRTILYCLFSRYRHYSRLTAHLKITGVYGRKYDVDQLILTFCIYRVVLCWDPYCNHSSSYCNLTNIIKMMWGKSHWLLLVEELIAVGIYWTCQLLHQEDLPNFINDVLASWCFLLQLLIVNISFSITSLQIELLWNPKKTILLA